jgi:hypothetical protein
LSALEVKYDCASMCNVPLFYLQRNVDQGPVERECLSAAMNALSNNMNIAIAFAVTGGLLFFAFFAAIPLCSCA